MTYTAAVKMKTAMAERGLTQVMLAEAVGISQPYLSQILSGEKEPRPSVGRRLAKELGLSLDDIYGDVAATGTEG